MNKNLLILIIIFLFLVSSFGTGSCNYYKVTVNRESENLYKDLYSGIYFKTLYCYVYAYGEDAIFDDNRMELYFTQSKDT